MPVTIDQKDFHDFEALQNVVQDSRSEIVQLGAGRMSGKIAHLALDENFGISTGHYSRGMRVCGPYSQQRWSFATLLESDGPASSLNRPLHVGDIVSIAPKHERYACTRSGVSYFGAFVAPEELQRFLASDHGSFEAMMRKPATVMAAPQAVAASNAADLKTLVNALTEHGPSLSDDVIRFHKRNIMELLTAPIRDGIDYRPARLLSPEKLVREADHFLIEQHRRPIHVSELCEHFHMHRRTLHRIFHDVLGIAPITLLRQIRLSAVHTRLSTASHHLNVEQVAREHGFLQLGRFAAQYRHLFGEKPSHTLKRALMRLFPWWGFLCCKALPIILCHVTA